MSQKDIHISEGKIISIRNIDKESNNIQEINAEGKLWGAMQELKEGEAVEKAINLANTANYPLYIVHVSTRESLNYIRLAQDKGQKVLAKTCPQYLLLDDSVYEYEFDKACKYVMSPPLRKKQDQEALWQAIQDGIIQSVGTDHCPFTLEQKNWNL